MEDQFSKIVFSKSLLILIMPSLSGRTFTIKTIKGHKERFPIRVLVRKDDYLKTKVYY